MMYPLVLMEFAGNVYNKVFKSGLPLSATLSVDKTNHKIFIVVGGDFSTADMTPSSAFSS